MFPQSDIGQPYFAFLDIRSEDRKNGLVIIDLCLIMTVIRTCNKFMKECGRTLRRKGIQENHVMMLMEV